MTNPKLTRVVAAVVDTRNLTLYTESGETVIIPQGDPRVANIVRIVTPICSNGGVAELDLQQENQFSDVEKQSGGLIKMFRIARSKLASLFTKAEPVLPQVIGTFRKEPLPEAPLPLQSAIDQIMEHAVPATNADFNESNLHTGDNHQQDENEGETIVAVVGNTVLPDVHKLKSQIQHAVSTGTTEALQKFMERAGKCNRRHTLEDLMRFMQRGDLPIADDGSIVIYKILRKKKLADHPGFDYVDCHTGKVPQRIGSYVHMDESLVDPNRGQDCSNGLHVARRAYLSGFSGDVVVIAKVNPEDVIAVPQYDSNKMRVCGYHILAELGDEDYRMLKNNQAIVTDDAKRKLGAAISGNHVGITSLVHIGGHNGGNITVTDKTVVVDGEIIPELEVELPMEEAPMAEALPEPSDEPVAQAPVVDPKTVAKDVDASQAGAPTRADLARALYDAFSKDPTVANGQAVKDFKKSKKVSWDTLGITADEVAKLK